MIVGKPFVSIIVPVYKVEAYLEECIKSILNQSYENFELILVDDGSPDQCGTICDRWASTDHRVKVIHKANGGLSDARNVGIDAAKGELITFIDSDDFISKNYLEALVIKQQECQADIVQGEMTQDCKELGTVNSLGQEILTPEEAFRQLLQYRRVKVYACCKLYKKSLFTDSNIYYPVGRLNEDCATTYKLILHSKKIALLEDVIYFYRKTPNSILNSEFSSKRMALWNVPDEIRAYLGDKNAQYVDDLGYYKFRVGVNLINESANSKSPEIIKMRNKILADLKHLSVKKKYLNTKYRLIYDLLHISTHLYVLVAQKLRERS